MTHHQGHHTLAEGPARGDGADLHAHATPITGGDRAGARDARAPMARARRRRAVHAARSSVIGLGAAAAIALGAVSASGVWRDADPPVPPAPPVPTVTTVPSVTTAPEPPRLTPLEPILTMTGTSLRVPADHATNSTTTPWPEYWCGAPTEVSPDVNATTGLGVPGITTTGTAFRENGELIVRMSLTNTGPTTLSGRWLQYLGFTVERDGRRVGAANLEGSLILPTSWAPGTTLDVEMSAGPWTCTFMLGEPWRPGQYQVVANPWLAGPETLQSDGLTWIGSTFAFTLD